jgi:hypothetical protein
MSEHTDQKPTRQAKHWWIDCIRSILLFFVSLRAPDVAEPIVDELLKSWAPMVNHPAPASGEPVATPRPATVAIRVRKVIMTTFVGGIVTSIILPFVAPALARILPPPPPSSQKTGIAFTDPFALDLNLWGPSITLTSVTIDGRKAAINTPDSHYTVTYRDGTLSVLPHTRYWRTGPHNITVSVPGQLVRSYDFFVSSWDIDFTQESASCIINLTDANLSRGQVRLDRQHCVLVLEPVVVDRNNPSYVKTPVFTNGISDYRVAICYRITDPQAGGFQVTLPGGISIQIGDGDLLTTTIKVGCHYVDPHGLPTQIKKKEAMKIAFPGQAVCAREEWVWICRTGNCLSVYAGYDQSIRICDVIIDDGFLSHPNRQLAFRSYGSTVEISRIIVTVEENQPVK